MMHLRVFESAQTRIRVTLTDEEYYSTPPSDNLLFVGQYFDFSPGSAEETPSVSECHVILAQFASEPVLDFADVGKPPQYLSHQDMRRGLVSWASA